MTPGRAPVRPRSVTAPVVEVDAPSGGRLAQQQRIEGPPAALALDRRPGDLSAFGDPTDLRVRKRTAGIGLEGLEELGAVGLAIPAAAARRAHVLGEVRD